LVEFGFQLIAWKDSSPLMTYYVSSGTSNDTHLLTSLQCMI